MLVTTSVALVAREHLQNAILFSQLPPSVRSSVCPYYVAHYGCFT